jgi:hypothetical protein
MPATFARLRNHIITGFIFVMPVLITVAVIMKFWIHLLKIGGKCSATETAAATLDGRVCGLEPLASGVTVDSEWLAGARSASQCCAASTEIRVVRRRTHRHSARFVIRTIGGGT